MKENRAVVPVTFKQFKSLSAKMLYGFIKMGKTRLFPKHDYHYNHMKNLALVYFIFGNIIKTQSFTEVYNGDRANRFRKAIHESEGGMFPGCLRCYQNMLFGKKIKGY